MDSAGTLAENVYRKPHEYFCIFAFQDVRTKPGPTQRVGDRFAGDYEDFRAPEAGVLLVCWEDLVLSTAFPSSPP